MIRKFASLLAGLVFCACAFASQQFIITTPGIGTTAPVAGASINANFTELYGKFAGQIFIAASNDTSGVTDLANLQAAFTAVFASDRLPPLASAFFPSAKIVLGPGTFYFTSSPGNILGTPTLKEQGVWIQGSGRGVTSIDYAPVSAAPFLINNHALNVKISDITFMGHGPSDFLWSQELAGLTNVQDMTIVDCDWQGTWGWIARLTGSNNNSEWKWERDSFTGNFTGLLYTPPVVVATTTSSSSTVSISNTAEQVEVGDTGGLTSSCAPLAANTPYFVVSATTTSMQLSLTAGGSPVTFTASCTPNFQTASDQFLNHWFSKIKWWTQGSLGQWLMLNYGGNIRIRDSDISGHAPTSVAYVFNLLATANGPHAGGVMSFAVDGLRVEHAGDNSRLIHSQWTNGTISFNNLDESSQAGNRNTTNPYAFYEIINNNGPSIEYRNSQLMGVHNYKNNSSNFEFQNSALYENVTLLDNPTFANFITTTNVGNSGGFERIRCSKCRNNLNSNTVGYKEIVDTDLNWNLSTGGQTQVKTVSCVSANSDFPSTSGGSFAIRLPLNAMVLDVKYWNPAGSAGSATAYSYLVETTEGTPTVLATISGANASTPVPVSAMQGNTAANFVMTTDAARTIQIKENAGRASIFTGMYCLIDYIGKNIQPPANDEFFDAAQRLAA